jgi:kynurenine formamidase
VAVPSNVVGCGNSAAKPLGEPFTFAEDGFEATEYVLPTDRFGTQPDPPAHWNPMYPAIDELTDTLSLRPLVVMVRSDWHKGWNDGSYVARKPFPGVSLDALKFLHRDRRILLHGHEPLDTDSAPTPAGESWLLNNGYMQAEGVANHTQVPEAGTLVTIGFPKFRGGTRGMASIVAIRPDDWHHDERRRDRLDAPFPPYDTPLTWNSTTGTRTRE